MYVRVLGTHATVCIDLCQHNRNTHTVDGGVKRGEFINHYINVALNSHSLSFKTTLGKVV